MPINSLGYSCIKKLQRDNLWHAYNEPINFYSAAFTHSLLQESRGNIVQPPRSVGQGQLGHPSPRIAVAATRLVAPRSAVAVRTQREQQQQWRRALARRRHFVAHCRGHRRAPPPVRGQNIPCRRLHMALELLFSPFSSLATQWYSTRLCTHEEPQISSIGDCRTRSSHLCPPLFLFISTSTVHGTAALALLLLLLLSSNAY